MFLGRTVIGFLAVVLFLVQPDRRHTQGAEPIPTRRAKTIRARSPPPPARTARDERARRRMGPLAPNS